MPSLARALTFGLVALAAFAFAETAHPANDAFWGNTPSPTPTPTRRRAPPRRSSRPQPARPAQPQPNPTPQPPSEPQPQVQSTLPFQPQQEQPGPQARPQSQARAQQAQRAEPDRHLRRGLYAELYGLAGYLATPGVATSGAPTLLQFGLGGALGGWIQELFFVGAATDYRLVNQYSDATQPAGNRRGSRWNMASLMAGVAPDLFVLKAELEFLGSYNLSNTTALGDTVQYRSPIGGRFTVSYPVYRHVHAGVHAEFMSYGKQIIGGTDLALSGYSSWDVGFTVSLLR